MGVVWVCRFNISFTYVLKSIYFKLISVCLIHDYSLIANLHIFLFEITDIFYFYALKNTHYVYYIFLVSIYLHSTWILCLKRIIIFNISLVLLCVLYTFPENTQINSFNLSIFHILKNTQYDSLHISLSIYMYYIYAFQENTQFEF